MRINTSNDNLSRCSNHQEGLSLLELLLILVIAIGIIFLGINRYQFYEHKKDIAAVQQNVRLLFQATNIYYRVNCRANIPFQVSINNLINAGLMPRLFYSALVSPENYQVSATQIGTTQQTGKPIYELSVSAILNVPANTLPWYQQMLQATQIQGNQLVWTLLPSYTTPTLSSDFWISNTGLRQFKEMLIKAQSGASSDNSCAY